MKKIILPFWIFCLFSGNIFADNYSLDFLSGNYVRIPASETLSDFDEITVESGLVGYWNYNEGTGATLTD